MKQVLEVWIDCDLCPLQPLGMLAHDRGQVRFHYDPRWLAQRDIAFAIDPQLSLDAAPFFPKSETGNFGIFLDSSPDRWGQTLMRRREALLAKDNNRPARTLYPWDFLLGVQDLTRQGALRFRLNGSEAFLAHEDLAAPPVTCLAELADIARELTRKNLNDLNKLRRWLAVLVAPGASLGGARPKANFCENDGTLWIAKFPAHEDDRDMGAWEWVTWKLADKAKVSVPLARLERFIPRGHHTFCVKRFDRRDRARRFYASAMTLLEKDVSEGTSYIELAEFLANHGDPHFIPADLEQLFRRVAFNVAVGNRDDHLRNHGFILEQKGWRLSPAFDINPNIDKGEHVLNIDEVDNRPSLDLVLATADFYRVDQTRARAIVDEVVAAVDAWRTVASQTGISRADIELTASAFSAHAEFKGVSKHPRQPAA